MIRVDRMWKPETGRRSRRSTREVVADVHVEHQDRIPESLDHPMRLDRGWQSAPAPRGWRRCQPGNDLKGRGRRLFSAFRRHEESRGSRPTIATRSEIPEEAGSVDGHRGESRQHGCRRVHRRGSRNAHYRLAWRRRPRRIPSPTPGRRIPTPRRRKRAGCHASPDRPRRRPRSGRRWRRPSSRIRCSRRRRTRRATGLRPGAGAPPVRLDLGPGWALPVLRAVPLRGRGRRRVGGDEDTGPEPYDLPRVIAIANQRAAWGRPPRR
jgi:hypothetical protein